MIDADIDGNGMIDFEEFLAVMTHRLEDQEKENELIDAFKCFDRDGDGTISLKEIKFIVCTLGENQKLSEKEAEEMMRAVDSDGDGVISYKEFVNLMMSRIRK